MDLENFSSRYCRIRLTLEISTVYSMLDKYFKKVVNSRVFSPEILCVNAPWRPMIARSSFAFRMQNILPDLALVLYCSHNSMKETLLLNVLGLIHRISEGGRLAG